MIRNKLRIPAVRNKYGGSLVWPNLLMQITLSAPSDPQGFGNLEGLRVKRSIILDFK